MCKASHFFSALMAWFLALASKMIGKEIPMILEVGMAPGGKIKKPKEEVEEYLQHFMIKIAWKKGPEAARITL